MKVHTPRLMLTGSLIASWALTGYGCGGDSRKFGDDKNDASVADASSSGGLTSGNGGSSVGGASGAGTGGAGKGGTGTGGSGKGGSTATGGSSSKLDGGSVDAASDAATCTANADCDDGNVCNGTETCSGGLCKSGTQSGPGTPCTPYLADGGSVSIDAGVSYVCDMGQCTVSCTTDAECDDGNICTGKETCSPSSHVCQQGIPLTCDDKNACTDDECDPIRGCFYPLIDADGDGHAAETLGACGDDCNDKDATIFGGASELCDGKDNNCNGTVDETAPDWYADCDGDGFAPTGATSTKQCAKPTTAPASCSGVATATWTSVPPAAGTTDCWDKDATAHPRTATDNDAAWSAAAISGAPVSIDYDYNCDNTEEKRFAVGSVSTSATCTYSCTGRYCICSGPSGYTAAATPACGATAAYTYCGFAGCARTTSTQQQQCR
ncbi:MAG TPA: putative metal-binding motif-containing protein [Polyangiaceae bacterium]|jgi:hypothetical protein|nr:putative metal-binding motif-containing protein [Polyangiaceae bacterium]